MHDAYALKNVMAPDNQALETCVQWVQQTADECVVDINEEQKLLDDLGMKLNALAEWLGMSHDDCVGGLLGSEAPT